MNDEPKKCPLLNGRCIKENCMFHKNYNENYPDQHCVIIHIDKQLTENNKP